MLFRSLFFAPANRSDLLTKFPRFSADCYVVDLEDGTPPDDKIKAREALADNIGMLRKAEVKGLVYVRVNEPGSSFYLEDIAAAVKCDIDGIVIPKLETPSFLQSGKLVKPRRLIARSRSWAVLNQCSAC